MADDGGKETIKENINLSSSASRRPIPSNEEIIDEITKELNDLPDKCSNSLGETLNEPTESDALPVSDKDILEDFDHSEDESTPFQEEDFIDEEALSILEKSYTEEKCESLRLEADELKSKGNELFKTGDYEESASTYTKALRTCPLAFEKERAVLYSNRAAAKMKLNFQKSAICDCSKAIELNPQYVKALFRRAQLYEETEKLEEALADYKKILELDPGHKEALGATYRLPEQINERNEKLKTEMLGKLKDLGNMILRPFGLSTNNFQLNQDPNSGGYSINFKQNAE